MLQSAFYPHPAEYQRIRTYFGRYFRCAIATKISQKQWKNENNLKILSENILQVRFLFLPLRRNSIAGREMCIAGRAMYVAGRAI